MKGLLPALVGIVLTAATAAGQLAPVKAGVYRWAGLVQASAPGRRVERVVLTGSTLDLEALDVRAITMLPSASPDTAAGHDSLEYFVLVKEGKLMASLGGVTRVLGAGGAALVLPGDRMVVTNVGGAPATY